MMYINVAEYLARLTQKLRVPRSLESVAERAAQFRQLKMLNGLQFVTPYAIINISK